MCLSHVSSENVIRAQRGPAKFRSFLRRGGLYCKAAIHYLLTWVRAAGTAYENGVQDASTTLYSEMGEMFDRDMCERADLKREFSPESYFLLTGSEDQLKRNAHTDPRGAAGGHVVEWSALLAPGGLRPFCISVLGALHYEANKTGIDRLLQCMFGPCYTSDVDSVESTPGAKNGLFGAIVTCQLTGHATSIAGAMRNWVKFVSVDINGAEMAPILGIVSPFKKVNGIPPKAQGTTAYACDLA